MIHVDLHAVAGFQDALTLFPRETMGDVYAATLESSLLLQRETMERAPVGVGAGGGLRGSIQTDRPRLLSDRVIGEVGSSIPHAVPVELGTKPHMPPVTPLADWAHAKLGLPEEEARAAAWGMAMTIKKRGTEGAHMFGEAFAANADQVQRIYEKHLGKAVGRLR